MGSSGVKVLGKTVIELGGITAPESVVGVLKVVDVATKDSHGGRFWTYEGEELAF
jgi:norsolorinic acid ketoreductase